MYPRPVFFSPSVSSGGFILPLLRTSVRYKNSRSDLCSYCVSHQMASFCAYPAWYLIPWWRRSRVPTGPPLGRLIYGDAVSSCSPLITIHPLLPASPFPLFFFLICVLVRLACRLVGRLVMPSRFVRSVVSCRPSCRPVCSSRPSFRLSSRMGTVSFCCSLVLVSPVVAILPCVLMSSRFRLGVSSRSCVSSIVSSAHLVLVPSSRSVSPVGVSDPFSCPVPVFAPFRPARRSFLFAYSVSVHVLGRGAWPCRYGHGAVGWLALLISSVPSWFPILYSLTRCGAAAVRRGHEAPFYAARRSSLVCSCLLVLLIPSWLLIALMRSHPIAHEARKPGAEDDRTGTRKQAE